MGCEMPLYIVMQPDDEVVLGVDHAQEVSTSDDGKAIVEKAQPQRAFLYHPPADIQDDDPFRVEWVLEVYTMTDGWFKHAPDAQVTWYTLFERGSDD